MRDRLTRTQRSWNMSRIRGRDNKETEGVILSLLRRNGITGWRRHLKLLGRPDFAFIDKKVALFVDGCFWHGCPRHSNLPKSNRTFWKRKFITNKERDLFVSITLRSKGWKVVRIWEHELTHQTQQRVISRIKKALHRNKITD